MLHKLTHRDRNAARPIFDGDCEKIMETIVRMERTTAGIMYRPLVTKYVLYSVFFSHVFRACIASLIRAWFSLRSRTDGWLPKRLSAADCSSGLRASRPFPVRVSV